MQRVAQEAYRHQESHIKTSTLGMIYVGSEKVRGTSRHKRTGLGGGVEGLAPRRREKVLSRALRFERFDAINVFDERIF